MNHIFAFIVGIEKYDQLGWNISGPCANAIAIANWLLSIQVPANHIFLFLDAVQDLENEISTLGADGVQVRRCARWDTIDTFWRNELAKGRLADSRLLVYWSGHGFTENDGWRVFICRDYSADRMNNRVFSASSFLRHLRSPEFQCFQEQIFLADVCANYTNLDFDAGKRPPKSVVAAARQVAYFATPEGQYAHEQGRGVFTETALAVLKRFNTWPELKTFGQRMDAAFENVGQTPFRIAVFTDETEIQNHLVGSIAKDAGSTLFHSLWSLFSPIPVPESVYRFHYLRTVSDLGNPGLAKAQGLMGMIHELTSLCDNTSGLMRFLVRLTQEDELKDPVEKWLKLQAADQAHVLANVRQKIKEESRQKILIVEVMVDQRGNIASFQPFLRTQNLVPVPDCRFPSPKVNSWDEFEGKLKSLIEDVRSKHSVDQIHFLADPPLFDRPFHRIFTSDGIPLGENFVVVVRYRERLRNANSVIRKLWNDYAEALRCSKPYEVKLVPVWCPDGKSGQPLSDERGLCYACFAVQPASQGGSANITEEKKRLLKLLRLGAPYLYWPHQAPPCENWDQIIEDQLTAWLKNLKTLDQFPDTFTEGRAYEKDIATQATLLWDDPQFHPFLSPRGIELR
ncbi:MAG: caspase family protein [Candidatus Competibacteraceae bacterium]